MICNTFVGYDSFEDMLYVIGGHDNLSKCLTINMGICLFDGREMLHLEHITADVVKTIIKSIQESIHTIILNQLIELLNISSACPWIRSSKVSFMSQTF